MAETESGPVDVVLIGFEGNNFNGEVGPALRALVEQGLIRVLDLLFVYKDGDGKVGSVELAGLSADLEPAFVDIDGQLDGGLLDADDVEFVAEDLEPDTSVAVVAVENLWAVPFIKAVRGAGGVLIDQVRVPSHVVDAVRQAAAQGA